MPTSLRIVEAKWLDVDSYFSRHECKICGFTMIGANRVLEVGRKNGGPKITICDGCTNAIGEKADGKVVFMSGDERAYV